MEDQQQEPNLETPQQPAEPQPHQPSSVRSWTRDLLVSVLVSMFIILFLYQPVRVEGTSMLPGLVDEDRLLLNKFAYSRLGSLLGDEIHRNDVVVFYYPYDVSKSYIKRVIAIPGDDVRIDHGTVMVNGMPLKETYVPRMYQDERSFPEQVVPQGEYFVLGDHRSVAADSRDFGMVPRKLIYGKAAFVYWPMDQAGVVH